jgi:hypothetical protein
MLGKSQKEGEPSMRLLRHLQHWLTGLGRPLAVADFVPETHPLRQWADTLPWPALVAAVERSFAQRFPTPTARGRAAVATRVLLAPAVKVIAESDSLFICDMR